MGLNADLPTAEVFDQLGNLWSEIAEYSTEEQVKFVRQILKSDGLILDLCCGDGRHSTSLCKLGFRMVGLDISRALLLLAKKNAVKVNLDFPLVRADMRLLPFRAGIFSAVVSMDSSFGYLKSKQEDLRSLREIERVLGANGVFLIDVFNRDHLIKKYDKDSNFDFWAFRVNILKRFPLLTGLSGLSGWREYRSLFLLQKRRTSSSGDRLIDLWAVLRKESRRISVYRHVVRLYSLEDLIELLKIADLDAERTYGNYQRQNYSSGSKRLIVLARKRSEITLVPSAGSSTYLAKLVEGD